VVVSLHATVVAGESWRFRTGLRTTMLQPPLRAGNDGLCMRNGENAAISISVMTWWLFFPRRLSGRPALVAPGPD